jgi:hypothetical protein
MGKASSDGWLDYAEVEATSAGLSRDQVSGMQAFLLGAVLTFFDESPIVPMTDSRWRRLVRAAIEEEQS